MVDARLRVLGEADPGDRDEPGEELLTIEQLAARTGMTVRNIRSHRARGLLPAPVVRERIGYYGPDHLARLRLILELQAEGFNLQAIKRLLEQTRGGSEQLLHLKQALGAPWASEEPQVFTLEELSARFGPDVSAEALARAEQVGAIVSLGEDRYEAPSALLLEVAEEVISHGIPLAHALSVIAKVQERCGSVAHEFVRLFLDDLWKPFAAEGYPEARWGEVVEAIERLRPMSSQALLAVYQLTMSREVEAAFGKELRRLSKGRR